MVVVLGAVESRLTVTVTMMWLRGTRGYGKRYCTLLKKKKAVEKVQCLVIAAECMGTIWLSSQGLIAPK